MSQPQTSAIADGADVMLGGLSKAVLNGATGKCLGVDATTGRYKIQLVGSAARIHPKPILLKRENLQLITKQANIMPSKPQEAKHPSAWSDGLEPLAAAEWFVDCYRMRCDDDYALGGGNLHGLYNYEASAGAIVFDFLQFCLLAVAAEVAAGFDWSLCIDTFGYLLGYAFEKSDAQEKYGRENVFLAMMGGRSLRFTATQVYGCGPEYGSEPDEASQQRIEEVLQQVGPLCAPEAHNDNAVAAIDSHSTVFEKVGGSELWKAFLLRLEAELPNR
mmetsp:Transcript_23349/g.51845  ORF Transcript_23349/g.51845 Transcript_23349/m.51845 type:complete len:275 (+) Transcript_23349:13-837(+)